MAVDHFIDVNKMITRPHIFFDDQMTHLEHLVDIPAVHIPFGIANKVNG